MGQLFTSPFLQKIRGKDLFLYMDFVYHKSGTLREFELEIGIAEPVFDIYISAHI